MMNDIKSIVWNEKYRPQNIEDFLLSDDLKSLISSYIQNNTLDNLIFYGSTGVGKTSIVRYLLKNIDCDVLSINASEERGIDTIRDKVVPFAQRNSLFSLKVVDFREGEKLTKDSQDALKDVIEESYQHTKFIFTTNNIDGIISPIRGRFTELEVYPSKVEIVAKKMGQILEMENVSISVDQKKELWKFIKRAYPNIRKIINTIQTSSRSGDFKLIRSQSHTDDFDRVIDLINSSTNPEKSYKSVRPIINSIPSTLIEEIFGYFYMSVDEIDVDDKLNLINTIADYNYHSGMAVDKELNVASMIIKILQMK